MHKYCLYGALLFFCAKKNGYYSNITNFINISSYPINRLW